MFFSASRLLIPAASQDSSAAVSRSGKPGSLLSRTGMAIWYALEDFGQLRAHRQLRLMADRCAFSDPELARLLRDASSFDSTSRPRASAAASTSLAAPAGVAQARS